MPPPEADIAVANCRDWLEWAAVQVDVCLADDKPACDQLLDSLAKILGSAAADQQMSAAVIAVQSHDRVMQRLNHVAESLRRLQEHLGDARLAQSAESWRALRENQMRAFSMAEERALFARIVARGDDMGHGSALDSEDATELFLPEHGLEQP
jgi:hypothetical protein